jgi:hypothetical protein
MSRDVTRAELLAELDRLVAEEGALRTKRSLLTYRLEQCLRERQRIERHLKALSREQPRLAPEEVSAIARARRGAERTLPPCR